jgi:hypothetical protein
MSKRVQIYVLVLLVVALAAVYFFTSRTSGLPGVIAADGKFAPLSVQEPQLRLDLLDKLHKLRYQGTHRDIFTSQPLPPPPPSRAELAATARAKRVGPDLPPPPPPLDVPAQFFGYASMSASGRRVAFFAQGDEIYVVAEGDTFLGRFRLSRIGTDSADVEEISSGRHAHVPLVPSAEGAAPNSNS